MKKLYFILFILLNQVAFSQGNLQFNQVKLVTAQETVPVGKVWKVESVIYNIAEGSTTYQTGNYGNCTSSDYNSAAIIVAGTPTKVGQGTTPLAYSSGAYVHSYTILPIWLPAGTTLSGGICLNKISVIEFNITP
ncbi:MAG: hypothetical protein K9I37_06110 [Crocinitomicaceae bacterium]|nr:hypothetical protein [Crocinitomicaceae bacterium]